MKIFQEAKTIWPYMEKYKAKILILAFLVLVDSIIIAFIPYLYGKLVDLAATSNLFLIMAILFFWLILALIGDWLGRYTSNEGSYVALDAGNDMLIKAAGHLIDLPQNFHKNNKMGEMVQRCHRGADYLETIINQVVFSIGPSFITALAILVFMALIEWKLSLLLLIILMLYSLASVFKTKPIISAQKQMNRYYEKAYGDLYDSITNISTVKSFTREDYEKQKTKKNFVDKAGENYKDFMGLWKDLNAWQQSIFSIGFVFIFGFAVFLLQKNTITTGQFVMFIGYVSLAYRPFGRLAENYRVFRTGLTAIHRTLALLKATPEPYAAKRKNLANAQGQVEFQNVSFNYQRKQKKVLIDINFKAKPGQMIALVGASGVGKSTLINLISNYYKPTQGKILIDNCDVQKISLKSLRANIAVVPQEVMLFNDTIKNNIAYAKEKATDQEIEEAAKMANAHEFILKFTNKYKQLVGERGIKLSTGQKQRVAIARAILRNPKILILDEATSSLDSATEKKVQEALEYLMKGRTTFVIAHRLSTIQKADLILVLEKGRIVERGDHQELVNHGGVYHKLNKLQSTVIK